MPFDKRAHLCAAVGKSGGIGPLRFQKVARGARELSEVVVPMSDGGFRRREAAEGKERLLRHEVSRVERNRKTRIRRRARWDRTDDGVVRNAFVAASVSITVREQVIAPDEIVRVLAARRGRADDNESFVPNIRNFDLVARARAERAEVLLTRDRLRRR